MTITITIPTTYHHNIYKTNVMSCHMMLCCFHQELVVYVNGVPYTRRELEMPAAALHHAGVQAGQVRDMWGRQSDRQPGKLRAIIPYYDVVV